MARDPALHRILRLAGIPILAAAALVAPACDTGAAKSTMGLSPDRGLVVQPPDVANPAIADLNPRNFFHDFGNIRDGDKVEHVFRLKNVEDHPIAITSIIPACGCTVPTLSYTTSEGLVVEGRSISSGAKELLSIPPGMEADLRIEVDTKDVKLKNSDQVKTITVRTDSDVGRFRQLEVHFVVEAPFQIVPNGINLSSMPLSTGKSGKCDIVQIGGFAKRVVGIRSKPDNVTADLRLENRFGTDVWVLEAGFVPPLTEGQHTAKIVLDTVDEWDEPYKPLVVRITGKAVTDVQADPPRLIIVVDKADPQPVQAQVVLFSLLAGQRLKVLEAAVEPEHAERLAVALEAHIPDQRGRSSRWTLRLTATPPIDEMLQGFVTVKLDDAKTPEVRVKYVVHVR